MIEAIRKRLPRDLRQRLKNVHKFSYLIAPLYGYLMLPRFDGTALIVGEGTKFFAHPDISAIDCLREIFGNNVYEKYWSAKDGDVVIDIGANVGIFTVKVGEKLNKGLIVAIEPSPQNIELLKKNLRLHNLSSVIVVPKAVGNFRGKSKFLITPVSGQHRFYSKTVEKSEEINKIIEVDTVLLDDIVKELKIKVIDFLKIDVEGAELDVLKGAKESLKFTKNIAMELHYEGEGEEVRRFLEERGFTVKIVGSMLYASKQ